MNKRAIIHHILFWIFVFLWIFDYMVFVDNYVNAIALTFFELLFCMIYCYVNLYILIPKLLIPKGKIKYSLGLLALLGITYLPYSYFYYHNTGLNEFLNQLEVYEYEASLLGDLGTFTMNYILYIVISTMYWYLMLYQKEKQNRLILQNDKLQAELLLLKSQVSPHFLFNSLNNIYSLSLVKSDNAPVMIEKMSDILRYLIYEGKNTKVALEREVELLNNYIELQLLKKIKAEKNIRITSKGIKKSQQIPPLLLIGIVENSFKHSDIGYNENGFLNINITVTNKTLTFIAKNSYKAKEITEGIGLNNLEKQLNHYYPDKHQLRINRNKDIFHIELQIEL